MDALLKLWGGVLWAMLMLGAQAFEVIHTSLEWVALAGGALGGIVLVYKAMIKPIYETAQAVGDALPHLERLPERLLALDERDAHIEERLRERDEQIEERLQALEGR